MPRGDQTEPLSVSQKLMKVYVISYPPDRTQHLAAILDKNPARHPAPFNIFPSGFRTRWISVLAKSLLNALLCLGVLIGGTPARGVSTEPLLLPPLRWRPSSLSAINEELTLSPSASLSLSRWCFHPPAVTEHSLQAVRLDTPEKPASRTIRQLLGVGPKTLIRYRRVALTCHGLVVSEADNWYVPERLTRIMNQQLDKSQTPFGLVVQPLSPLRVTLMSRLNRSWNLKDLWAEKTPSFMGHGDRATVLEIRALLVTARGPISLVEEHYSSNLLDLAEPPARH